MSVFTNVEKIEKLQQIIWHFDESDLIVIEVILVGFIDLE